MSLAATITITAAATGGARDLHPLRPRPVDTGRVSVAPTWTWSLGFTVKNPGEYWVRIQTTSESLIPKADFQRVAGAIWTSFASYKPGDFAVFSLTRKRLW